MDTFMYLMDTYGLVTLFFAVLGSCMGLPSPSTPALLVVGSYMAIGNMSPWLVLPVALAGAVTGDQIGYWIGYWGGHKVEARLRQRESRAKKVDRVKAFMLRYGGPGVFFTRWLLSPLGPTSNFLYGASEMRWARYTFWGVLGEMIWVLMYSSIGYLFGENLDNIIALASRIGWSMTGAALGLIALYILFLRWRKRQGQGVDP